MRLLSKPKCSEMRLSLQENQQRYDADSPNQPAERYGSLSKPNSKEMWLSLQANQRRLFSRRQTLQKPKHRSAERFGCLSKPERCSCLFKPNSREMRWLSKPISREMWLSLQDNGKTSQAKKVGGSKYDYLNQLINRETRLSLSPPSNQTVSPRQSGLMQLSLKPKLINRETRLSLQAKQWGDVSPTLCLSKPNSRGDAMPLHAKQ
ncbi:unnamed protein product [Acanthosepion pharaonis]|uniref:Uncharacterized protein n=1 Tax=Acanthosepion pharaonis TaxID=158019 RepID=A0A812B9N3_ACAPH|nr:unnamed protein product [Sepia pharaonis]